MCELSDQDAHVNKSFRILTTTRMRVCIYRANMGWSVSCSLRALTDRIVLIARCVPTIDHISISLDMPTNTDNHTDTPSRPYKAQGTLPSTKTPGTR